ncbi:glycosyltransferase family 2 protein [Stieleria varia]|uniref:Putative glycosyltransferase EpsE n=1 Tax=Stieleria varia TaxID=2528005 RepID=A0A5C6BAE2_9BACT|nr:glycosyltransferase family A protein [Stieleria varia]TWU08249.1 putative glycosyltransferase EpsE [Stieleria varia]
MTQIDELNCPFRREIRGEGDDEYATCDFLHRLTDAPRELCNVHRSACELCVQHPPLSPSALNPVLPSLILDVCANAFPDASPDTVGGVLQSWAKSAVATDGVGMLATTNHGCDCVLICEGQHAESDLRIAIDSALAQERVQAIVHVIANGADSFAVADAFRNRPNIRVHRHPQRTSAWQCLHAVLEHLETQWVALLVPGLQNMADRLCHAIDQMETEGGEIFAAAIRRSTETGIETLASTEDNPQLGTLVIRRGTLADLGGWHLTRPIQLSPKPAIVEKGADAGSAELWSVDTKTLRKLMPPPSTQQTADFVSRKALAAGNAPDFVSRKALAAGNAPDLVSRKALAAGNAPLPADSALLLTIAGHAQEKSPDPFFADVVLPFRNALDQVAQSLDALLAQTGADVVIHLVDDWSSDDVSGLFDRYRDHPNIRFYRNRENLGPFASFNNIALRAETGFIAVQDADDISLPHRIARSVQLLLQTGADMIGSRSELFGEVDLVPLVAHDCETDQHGVTRYYRNSRYPKRHLSGYFLENPTLVMRVDTFRSLGGYGDFGGGPRNRTGVDTDFQLRAHFARAAITVTRDALVRYRVHGQSATQHSESGFGSQANAESHAEVRRRFERYCTGTFDPRWFGALGQHAGLTERIDP